MPHNRDLLRGLTVLLLVLLLPWLGIWLSGGSAFGFPSGAFLLLLGGPVLLIAMAHPATEAETDDHG